MRSNGFLSLPVRRAIGAFALAWTCFAATPADAIQVTCVEASKYKYLYRIFDNDRRGFAEFLGVDIRQLPDPEACRAALLTGRIDPATRETMNDNDFTRLLAVVGASRGWLTTLYLGSNGGNVQMGLRLGQLTRMLWLKTHAVDGKSFDYVPDFLGSEGPGSPANIPPELQGGWQAYVQATQGISRISLSTDRPRRCVSACTFIHAGGIQRYGRAYFHRARRGTPRNREQTKKPAPSMTEILERLHKVEALIVAYFRQMDAGEAAIQAYESTATQTTKSALMPPVPRYVEDHLRGVCNRSPTRQSPEQRPRRRTERSLPMTFDAQEPPLQRSPRPFGRTPQTPSTSPSPSPQNPSPQSSPDPAAAAGGHAVIRCVAAAHMQEGLSQYGKLCATGCDQMALFREATRRVRALTPDEAGQRPATQTGGGNPSGGGTRSSPRGLPRQGGGRLPRNRAQE
jgi:hypothetical protein